MELTGAHGLISKRKKTRAAEQVFLKHVKTFFSLMAPALDPKKVAVGLVTGGHTGST